MTVLIETDRHVFEVEWTPDTPGWCRRELTVKVLSGPELSEQEWRAFQLRIARCLIDCGMQVKRTRLIDADGEDA